MGEFVTANGNKFYASMYPHLKGNIIYKKGYGLFYCRTAIYSRFLKNIRFMVPFRLETYILKKANLSLKALSVLMFFQVRLTKRPAGRLWLYDMIMLYGGSYAFL